MRRRDFLGVLSGLAATWPLAARAQQPGRVRQIALLFNARETDAELQGRLYAFRTELGVLGWNEGQNLRIEIRWTDGIADRIEIHAQELVRLAPEAIFTNGTPTTAALKRATSTIPIVFAIVSDPVGDGFAASLARPGGNITGFSSFDSEVGGKWMELLKEIAPGVRRAALLFNPRTVPGGGTAMMRPFFDAAAHKLAVEPVPMPVESTADIERSLKSHAARPDAALMVMPDGYLLANAALIISLVNALRLPTVYPFRHYPVNDGLMSYGVDSIDLNRRAAAYVDRILKGANPAELPIQRPVKFDLVINLKTAKTLGLTVPPSLIARADEVIE